MRSKFKLFKVFTFLLCFGFVNASYATTEDLVNSTSKPDSMIPLGAKTKKKEKLSPAEKSWIKQKKANKKAHHEEKAYFKSLTRSLRQEAYTTDSFLKSAELNANLIFNHPKSSKRGPIKELAIILSGGNSDLLGTLSLSYQSLKGIEKQPVKWKQLSLGNRLNVAQKVLEVFAAHLGKRIGTLTPPKLKRESYPIPLLFITYCCFKSEENALVSQIFAQSRDKIFASCPDLIHLLDVYSFPNLIASSKITKEE